MDLSPQNRTMLPIWILAWITSAIILADGMFLRAEPLQAQVHHLNLTNSGRDRVCKVHVNILDSSRYSYGYRETDHQTCRELKKGQQLQLNRTLLLHRWTSMENTSGERVTSESLDRDFVTDLMFIVLSLILPMLLAGTQDEKQLMKYRVAAAFIPIGIVYYWYSILLS